MANLSREDRAEVWRALRTPKTEAGRELFDGLSELAKQAKKPDLILALRAAVLKVEDQASAFGLAWNEAAGATPDGWSLRLTYDRSDGTSKAEAVEYDDWAVWAHGDSPAAALTALTAKLRERERK